MERKYRALFGALITIVVFSFLLQISYTTVYGSTLRHIKIVTIDVLFPSGDNSTASNTTWSSLISRQWQILTNTGWSKATSTNVTEMNKWTPSENDQSLIKNVNTNLTLRHLHRTIWDTVYDVPIPPKTDKVKIVLYYTTWFGMGVFDPPTHPMDKTTSMFVFPNGTECDYKCKFTYNRTLLHSADAVLFHGNDIPRNIRELSKNRTNLKQRWVYETQENAYNAGPDAGNFNGIFNWTMSYRLDSDSPFTYFEYFWLTPEERAKVNQSVNYAKGKTHLLTWSVSHCRTASMRDQVVQKLTEFLPISINGRCAHLFPKRLNMTSCGRRHSPSCAQFYKSTKFYIAFENGMCEDYISEKYAEEPFGNGMIPIVFGPQEYYQKLAIPGSYINLFDFPSIEALASYIKYLDKNDTAYNEYFQWRTKYKVSVDRTSYACLLCQKLHDDSLPSKVYNDLGALHGHAQCDKNLEKIKKYL